MPTKRSFSPLTCPIFTTFTFLIIIIIQTTVVVAPGATPPAEGANGAGANGTAGGNAPETAPAGDNSSALAQERYEFDIKAQRELSVPACLFESIRIGAGGPNGANGAQLDFSDWLKKIKESEDEWKEIQRRGERNRAFVEIRALSAKNALARVAKVLGGGQAAAPTPTNLERIEKANGAVLAGLADFNADLQAEIKKVEALVVAKGKRSWEAIWLSNLRVYEKAVGHWIVALPRVVAALKTADPQELQTVRDEIQRMKEALEREVEEEMRKE